MCRALEPKNKFTMPLIINHLTSDKSTHLCVCEGFSQKKIIKMKKFTLCMITAFLLLSIVPTLLKAGTATITVPMDSIKTIESSEIKTLTARLDEINAMDKSKLRGPEKRELRKEVRSIKSSMAAQGGGVYISVGALLIVILLLILLL